MINTAKNILFLGLIVLIGGAVFQPNPVFQPNAVNADSQCHRVSNSSITDDFSDVNTWLANPADSNPTEQQPKTISSCNSLSPTVVTTNHFSLKPDEQDFDIRHYNTILYSQTFVFQEPDPPRLG